MSQGLQCGSVPAVEVTLSNCCLSVSLVDCLAVVLCSPLQPTLHFATAQPNFRAAAVAASSTDLQLGFLSFLSQRHSQYPFGLLLLRPLSAPRTLLAFLTCLWPAIWLGRPRNLLARLSVLSSIPQDPNDGKRKPISASVL